MITFKLLNNMMYEKVICLYLIPKQFTYKTRLYCNRHKYFLFLLYINDVTTLITACKTLLYAEIYNYLHGKNCLLL